MKPNLYIGRLQISALIFNKGVIVKRLFMSTLYV